MYLIRDVKSFRFTIFLHLVVSYLCNNPTNSGAVSLTHATVDATLASNELVFINFYADWCRFSNLLAPIFDEAADKVAEEFPNAGQVVMGKVDCDKESDIASRFHITKYPTLKVIRNGQPAKREYRGQRSTEAFVDFIKKQLEDPIKEFHDLNELKNLDSKKRIIIGFFDRKDVPEYTTFRRVATNLKDDCQFHVGFGDLIKYELVEANNNAKVVYHPDDTSHEGEEEYKGSLLNFTEMLLWGNKCCIPLVRQITFENAEELTEEGLPLMILFHRSQDFKTIKRFKISCSQIRAERSRINFLYGDGDLFSHPLSHLGKTVADLPILAIDSFQHMYLFPDMRQLDDPDALERFIEDLYTGRLHREYHYGEEEEEEVKRAKADWSTDARNVASGRDVVRQMHPPGQPIVVFRPDVALSNERDETFNSSLLSYDETNVWMSEKCVPLVREITFENAEELTEEGLPFLILFHKPNDADTVKRYKDICQTLAAEKQNINFLTADGVKFAHPLHHLGKSQDDLPLIAIDSFRHMYMFPDIRNMDKPGVLLAFIKDLYSGKLHREFHYGPDTNEVLQVEGKVGGLPSTTPPESTFKKLGPSKNRYTLLRDEL